MKLQGRNLSLRLTGDDVKLLHSELGQLGLNADAGEIDAALFGATTQALIETFQARHGLDPTGIVDDRTAALINREVGRLAPAPPPPPPPRPAPPPPPPPPLVVRGRVVADNGAGAPDIAVRAFDRDMRSETLLGEAATDRLGRYEIRYGASQVQRTGKASADLIVRAVVPAEDARGEEVLAASETLFNAGPVATIDLGIDLSASRPSEFERLVAAVTPLLETVAFADLSEADLGFLEGETGIDKLHLAYLATAHAHAAATGIAPEAFYGLLRQGLPSALPALVLQRPATLKAALAASIAAHVIPSAIEPQLDAILAALQIARASEATAPPVRVLAAAELSPQERDQVLGLWLERDDDEGFWTALKASPLAAKAASLRAALDLAILTGNDAGLTEALAQRSVRSVQALAALSEEELKATILSSPETLAGTAAGEEGESDDAKAARLATVVWGLARARHPTAFLAAARARSDRPLDQDVARVLAHAPEIDLRTVDLERFLADDPQALQGVADPQSTRVELKRAQRVLRIAPDAKHAQALLDAGLDSAQAAARLSPAAFEAEFSAVLGGPEQARFYHARAKSYADTVLAIAGGAQQSASQVKPPVLAAVPHAVGIFPDLPVLFGSQDLCACRHCRSVLSPAAYLVDLLQFLDPKYGPRPITELRAQRPDIEHIALSCENTNTPLPYIDLANEILEFYVANGAITADAAHDTGGAEAADLAVKPEFVLEAAYQTLEAAVFPPSLPFQRPLETVRRHLKPLGTSREEVLRTFAAGGDNAALEALAISSLERDIMIGASPAPLGAHYGVAVDPSGATSHSAAQLMAKLGVDYDMLRLLLQTAHLDPDQAITLEDSEDPPRCDPTNIIADNLGPQFWQRAHRFVRLQRKLGIGVAELDRALGVLGGGDLTLDLLLRLALAEKLCRDLGLPRKILYTFWEAAPDPEVDRRRRDALARAMRLRPAELEALAALGGSDPFAPGDPGGLAAQAALLAQIRGSGLQVSELAWLYLPGHAAGASHAFSEVASLKLARAIQAALKALAADAEGGVDDLAALDARKRETIAIGLGEGLKLPVEAVRLLIESAIHSAGDPAQFLVSDLLSLADLAEGDLQDPAAPSVQPALTGIARLQKAALLIGKLGLSPREVAYIAAHGDLFDGFSFDALPLDPADIDPQAFAAWRRVAEFSSLSGGLPQRQSTLIDVFEAAALAAEADPRAAALAALEAATQWNAADLQFLVGPQGFDLASAADFADIAKLSRLARAIALARRLGISAERAAGWATASPDAAVADDVVAALAARHSPESWAEAGKAARDPLREAQRDALVAYILAHDAKVKARDITTPDGLFAYFLIDTQMCACMDTSRIKQAISSVQLFIQRALMDLESGVEPKHIDAEQWAWMRNYRVWEANRKVFLFPENWIEPELRDDKTPFFRELESRLLQDDIGFASAEAAVERYLDQLHEVARLDIRALHVEKPEILGGEEIVHIFARTLSSPHSYFYRRQVGGRTWTPWEKVDCGIEGDHLLPLIANRRLYLFWLHFEEREDPDAKVPEPFIQSLDHWLWTQELEAWRIAHDQWLIDHPKYQVWNATEAMFRKSGLPEDYPDAFPKYLAEQRNAYFQEVGLWDDVAGQPKAELPEPRRPDEPPVFSPPPIAHREITLNWSEYRGGVWSTKRSSTDPIVSHPAIPTVQQVFMGAEIAALTGSPSENEVLGAGMEGIATLAQLNQVHEFLPWMVEGSTCVPTFATVYLPAANEHYLTGSVDPATGRISVALFRRFETSVPVLNLAVGKLLGHDHLGRFEMSCGTMISPADNQGTMESLPFHQLARPDRTHNVAMAFPFRGGFDYGTKRLAFKAQGETRRILDPVPGRFTVLRDLRHQSFALTPPYQDFIFQDDQRAYLASPKREGQLVIPPAGLPKLPSLTEKVQAPLVLASQPTANLVAASASPSRRIIGSASSPLLALGAGGTDLLQGKPALPAAGGIDSGLAAGFLAAQSNAPVGHLAPEILGDLFNAKGLRFHSLVHPHVCAFRDALTRDGLPGLFDPATQALDGDPGPKNNAFARWYNPTAEVVLPYPREHVDFGAGPSALYNWELFFHVPMLVADTLTRNQRFEEAAQWYHFIFDPTSDRPGPVPERFWNCRPFFENSDPERDSVYQMLLTLAGKKPGWKDIADLIEDWRNNPFNPHLIARLRITAYQKNVVMKYIDNLVAWADRLFRRDTIEEINQATLLYILAGEILGPKPQSIAPAKEVDVRTYAELAPELDAFANALVEIEQIVPYSSEPVLYSKQLSSQKQLAGSGLQGAMKLPQQAKAPGFPVLPSPLVLATGLYFCPPLNEELLSRWDTVADRLFKIRHCMNIEGVARDLPLFEPPIDPALLVRATAAGIDLGSVLDDLYTGPPHYRFASLAQKATELCGEARALGAALLSALEKRDAEELTLLRSRHERAVLDLMEAVRIAQRDEAARSREALAASRDTALARYDHFQRMLGRESTGEIRETPLSGLVRMTDVQGAPMIEHERKELETIEEAGIVQRKAGVSELESSIASAAGISYSTPYGVGISWNFSAIWSALASYYRMQAAHFGTSGTLLAKVGGAVLRAADYALQSNLAVHEIRAIDKQLIAADVRIAICEAELASHRQQMENAKEVEDVLRNKFTSEELYGWMASQTSALYFQAYQLAYDIARRSERAWRHEIGAADTNFIRPGHWESLRKGLLAADRLCADLKRLEAAYLERNRRELEITRHVPLTQLDALAFVALKETGSCTFRLPEALFDMDYPGHYFRRLKSVSLTIPCVAGAYTGVNATLTLLKSEIRVDPDAQQAYAQDAEGEDSRFRTSHAAMQSIATSHAQNDSGLFELNFRDERYLPFEGAGAISEWRLDLPKDCNAFDFGTISEVVLHLKYTARDGGAALAQQARQSIANLPSQDGLHRLFSARNEFSNDWHRFLHVAGPLPDLHRLALDIGQPHFPFILRNKAITIRKLALYLKPHDRVETAGVSFSVLVGRRDFGDANDPVLPLAGGAAILAPLGGSWGNLLGGEVGDVSFAVPGTLALDIAASDLEAVTTDKPLSDLMIVAEYAAMGP